jgi:hypothetical protein
MEMPKLITRCSSVFIGIGFTAISLAAQSSVGYVVEAKGTWVLNGSTPLSQGQKLPAAGSIRRQSSSPDDRITIADMRGNILERASRNCAASNCSGAIILPRKAPSNWWLNAASAALGAAAETIVGSPNPRSSHLSRSGDLSDNVVKLTDSNLDLNSVLSREGEQYLRWRVVSLSSSTADWTKPIKLDQTELLAGFHPGLYEINLVRSNGSNFEPVAEAWILVATPAAYAKTRASFQAVQKLVDKWDDKVKPETTRLFLRASLDNLARQAVK